MSSGLRVRIEIEGIDPKGAVDCQAFSVAFDASILMKADGKIIAGHEDDLNQVFVLPHTTPGAFNVLSYSILKGQGREAVNFSVLHAEDALQLGDHLRALGVQQDVMQAWNSVHANNLIPLDGADVANAASRALTAMKGRPASGAATHRAKDGPA